MIYYYLWVKYTISLSSILCLLVKQKFFSCETRHLTPFVFGYSNTVIQVLYSLTDWFTPVLLSGSHFHPLLEFKQHQPLAQTCKTLILTLRSLMASYYCTLHFPQGSLASWFPLPLGGTSCEWFEITKHAWIVYHCFSYFLFTNQKHKNMSLTSFVCSLSNHKVKSFKEILGTKVWSSGEESRHGNGSQTSHP